MMARKPKAKRYSPPKRHDPQSATAGPRPTAAVTEHLFPAEMANLVKPWRSLVAGIDNLPTETAEDIRRNEDELRRIDGSEFSFGKGLEPPWVTRLAAGQRRYSRPDDRGNGGRYHGLTPRWGEFWPYVPPPQPQSQGSFRLHEFLHGNG
jgi:hypothetical protein